MPTSAPQKYGIGHWAAKPLASLFAAGYFVVATSVGVLLSLVPDEEGTPNSAGSAQVVTSTRATTYLPVPRTTTRPAATTPTVPPGYREVSGSFQLSTVVPNTWTVVDGSVSTTRVATDPADARREIRFGGAPPEGGSGTTLADRIGKAADENTLPGYRKTSLEPTTFNSHPAMLWEFEFTRNSVPRKVSAFYWEAQNVEYVIYASTTPDDWATMRAIVQTMKDRARP